MLRIFIISTLLLSATFSQVSISDINRMSNEKLDQIREEIKLLNNDESVDSPSIIETVDISSPASSPVSNSLFFGYSYFDKTINFFDNTPTPEDFKLGPGDQIVVSLWGETNFRKEFTINKEGMIYYADIGFISLSNKTLKEAESILEDKLSSIYATLKDKENSTRLMIELERLKSINVYFSGAIKNPGINVIHPFSDVFSAIIQAGGVEGSGSLRNVELIRKNQTIAKVDFYSFFMDGKNNFSSIKLIDGDVIHIPGVKKRVSISGEVNRPLTYELLPNESVSDIILYAAGFTSIASSTLIINQTVPLEKRLSDDNSRTSISINFKNKESILLNNGDNITVPPISEVDLTVQIFGRVKFPGRYPGANNTLKNVLDIAGGFDDPIFRQSIRDDEILVLRKDSNQFYGKELVVNYKDAASFDLQINDKIFVYEDIKYRNSFIYTVNGEVNKPGTYPFIQGLIVEEALKLAGGFTELSTERNIILQQEFSTFDENGNTQLTLTNINNVSLDSEVGINSIITVTLHENIVNIEGNVFNPGFVTYTKGYRYPQYIELAGGYQPDSLRKKAYIIRANGNIEKVGGFLISRGKKVFPGDSIIIPKDSNPQEFDITSFISDLSTTLANIAAILLIVDNQSKN